MAEIVVRWVNAAGILESGDLGRLAEARQQGWVWIDVLSPDQDSMHRLAQVYPLHPLAIEDVLHPQSRPKLDLYPDGLFIAWVMPRIGDASQLARIELDFFLIDGTLITVHNGLVEPLDDVLAEGVRVLSGGPDWVVHAILDRLVDALLPAIDSIGDRIEDLESRMLAEPRKTDLEELYALRRQLLELHRLVRPERDILRTLARERNYVSEDAYRYFEDIGDHIARVEDAIETYRDVGAAVMDIYLSAQSNRMNEIMKTLTIVATIFMPLTLISGIYGMNLVRGMWPPAGAPSSFWSVSIFMLVLGGWMAWFFRRRKWW